MQPLLFLALLVTVFAATFTIDCNTATFINPALNAGCGTGATYRVVNSSARGVPAANAWIEFRNNCPSTSFPSGDDTYNFIGTCRLGNGLYVDSDFDGVVTFQGDAGTPATFYIGGTNEYFLYTAEANSAFSRSFVVQDLIFQETGGNPADPLFWNQPIMTAESGNWTLSNIQLIDVYSTSNAILLDAYNLVPFTDVSPATVTVDDVEIYFSGAYTLETSDANFAAESFGPVFALGNGVNANINNINVHDTILRSVVGFYDSCADCDTNVDEISISLSNIAFDSITTYTDAGLLFNVESSAESDLRVSDFDITVDTISFTNIDFVGQNGDSVAFLGWTPSTNQYVAGTFSLSNVNIENVTIAYLGSHAMRVIGRGQTDFSGITATNVVVNTALESNGVDNAAASFLYFDGTDGATVADSSFVGNSGFIWGQITTGELTTNSVFSGLTFDSNTATSNQPYLSRGAAIHFLGSALVTDSTFNLNTAEVGGSVYIDNVDVFFDGCTFTNNTANVGRNRRFITGAGGAVLKNLEGLLSFKNSHFEFNSAKYGGGALAVVQDQLLDGSTTNQNDGGDLFLDNCVFDQNTASYGGAIYWYARDFIAQNTNFTQNSATTGGAVSASDINPFVSSPILFTNTRFENNVANGGTIQGLDLLDGGAVSTQRSATFEKSLFFQNQALAGNGGAITAYKGLSTSYAKFTENSASGVGGAIWSNPVQPQPLNLFRSDFDLNTAGQDGGAVWSNNPQTTLDGASFTTNSATGFGGAAYLATEATITGAGFVNNSASSGGAIFSVGDAKIVQSRFDSNIATLDGGAIDCISVPLGAVDFTLASSGNFFFNNQAGGKGGHLHTTCTFTDVGSTFQAANVADPVFSVECDGELRVLRPCELNFQKTKFISDSLQVLRPINTVLSPFSSGLELIDVTATTFVMVSEAESTNIEGSSFENYDITYDDTPTTIANSNFVNGKEDMLANGPFTLSGNDYQIATLNVQGEAAFDNCKFETSSVVAEADVKMVDVAARGGSSFDFGAAADLKRVNVDSTSTTVARGVTVVDDVTVGAYSQTTGSLDLAGAFTTGGTDLIVEIAVDVTGDGDFTFVDGTLRYTDGNFGGDGALTVEAGVAHFQAAGGVLSRATDIHGDLELEGTGAIALDSVLNVYGSLTFGQDATVTAGPLATGVLNIRGLVTFDQGNEVDVDTVSFANALWPIVDKDTYASVKFSKSFNWPVNATWTAHDVRTFVYWDQDFGNGTVLDSDYGNAFPIIALSAPLDTSKYNCHSPVDHVIYEYDAVVNGEAVVIVYPEEGAGRPFENNPAYVTCNDVNSEGPTATLTLYSGASHLQTLGVFVVVLLAALFF